MEKECKCPPPGSPAWMATFADLMSLLMCFFVLLLSFSEMDVIRFKQIAGSMKTAFGVQNVMDADQVPKGTSVIAQEFSPGRPEPTPIKVIMQQTADIEKKTLNFLDGESDRSGGQGSEDIQKDAKRNNQNVSQEKQREQSPQIAQAEREIEQTFKQQIEDGSIEVENLGQQLIFMCVGALSPITRPCQID